MTQTQRAEPASSGGGPWIDGHLDLAYLALSGRDLRRPQADPAVGCISYPALAEGGVRLVFATIFTEAGAPGSPAGYRDRDDREGAASAGRDQLAWYEAEEAAGRLRIVRTRGDLAGWNKPGPLSVVLLMECADPIASPAEAAWWYDRGVRLVGLSWAYGSRYAGGNARGGPLTREGYELVEAFDELGIVHDASHLSDESFDDLLDATDRLVVATHSNCRALLSPKERHLDDARIARIAARGGVVGLNLFGRFLAEGRRATIDDAVRHARRVARIGGSAASALGSDFDGGFGADELPEGLDHPSRLDDLARALRRAGATEAEIGAFARDNWLRVLDAALPAT